MAKKVIIPSEIDWQNSTQVISSAQKFILPVPKFKDGGEKLVYPEEHEKAGQPIVDWQGKPIGDKGLVFFNYKDNCYQAVKSDGKGVVIFNCVTEAQAQKLYNKIENFSKNPNELSLEQVKEILEYAKELGLDDKYNSDVKFIQEKMIKVGEDTPYPNYGLHKRDERDICNAVYISGSDQFQGPAAPQEFNDGAVILKQGNDVRLI